MNDFRNNLKQKSSTKKNTKYKKNTNVRFANRPGTMINGITVLTATKNHLKLKINPTSRSLVFGHCIDGNLLNIVFGKIILNNPSDIKIAIIIGIIALLK